MCTSSKNFGRDDAYKTLDTINMWIENCDNKASIILGSIGVIVSIILGSDFAKVIKNIVETAFTDIDFWKIVYTIIFSTAVIICLIGFGYFVSCITPKIILNKFMSEKIQKNIIKRNKDKKNFRKASNTKESIMFYSIVAATKYDQYIEQVKSICQDFDNVMADLVFQIHSASVICDSKFKKLQKGIVLFSIGLVLFFVQIVVGYYSFLK